MLYLQNKLEGMPFRPPAAAPLPEFIVVQSHPFASIGVDFARSLYVETSVEKSWIVLFTCCLTRALHLDLIRDMTAKSFLMSFNKFCARRGCPRIVDSDNAKTFKTVDKYLKRFT